MDNDQLQAPGKATSSPSPASIGGGLTAPTNQYTGQPAAMGQQPVNQATTSQGMSNAQPNLAVPDEAEMDKAWVDQAVVVLDKTRDDPFLQSQEIAKLRAQYMQSKFDKKIKLAQEQK